MIKQQNMVIDLLSVLFPESKIYLFGSRARGTHKVTSDVDLAIDTGVPINSLELIRAKKIIEALNIPQTFDLVDLNSIPLEMGNIILREGILCQS